MTAPDRPLDRHVAGAPVADHVVAVRWPDGTVECRARLVHPAGSLVADDGEIGDVIADPAAACTVCSDACTG